MTEARHREHGAPPPGWPADWLSRIKALRATRSCIVQAPAGSGKTELLIQRVLVLLTQVAQPEEVAAITFTRKAAAEMRQRVIRALRRAAMEPLPEAPHEQLTWRLARAVGRRDARLDWRLAENPQRIRTLTIDALSAELARRLPLLSRLGGPAAPTEDSDPLYREAARAALGEVEGDGEAAAAARRLLLHLDHNHNRAEDLLVALLARREQWLRHLPAADPAAWREQLEAALRREVCARLEAVRDRLGEPLVADIAETLRTAAGHLGPDSPSPILAWAGIAEAPSDDPDVLERSAAGWAAARAFFLRQDGDWRQAFNARVGVPAPSGASGPDKAERAQFKAWVGELSGTLQNQGEPLRQALDDVATLPYLRYPEGQWRAMEALLVLLPTAVAHLRRTFAVRGAVDFPEVARAAGRALEAAGDGGPEPIRHLLVDEFQDTSVTQFRLLEALTSGWRPGDGRSLFLVGDPMQSIYGFREAEVGLFLQARHGGVGDLPLEALDLGVNFRSAAPLVAWFNDAFPGVLPAEESPDLGAVPYARAAPRPGAPEAGGLRVHAAPARDDAAEAARVADLIEAEPSDSGSDGRRIAVLVRARSHAADILAALRARGISYRAVDMDPLASRPAVADLIALTRALLHPADRVAWLSVLRAPWCGLGLEDLLRLVADAGDATLPWLIAERAPMLPPEAAARLERTSQVLERALGARGRHPLRRWVEETWVALGGPACTDAAGMADAEAFLARLDALEAEGVPPTAESLESALERLYAAPDPAAGERVQVMTIHQAKGLQFDTVILPGLGRRPPPERGELLHWWERATGDGDLLLAPIAEAGDQDPCHAFLRQVRQARVAHETGRLVYVAATRARDTLHLLGHAAAKGDGPARPEARSLLSHLWPALEAHFADAAPAEAGDAAADPSGPPATPLRRLPLDWTLPTLPDPVGGGAGGAAVAAEREPPPPEYLWAGQTARHVGTVVHHALQRMAEGGAPAQEAGWIERRRGHHRAMLQREGVPAAELDEALARVEQALRHTLADARGRWVLGPHPEAENELALTGWLEGAPVHVRVDRMLVDDQGRRWIVDYKAGGHEGTDRERFLDEEQGRYRPQLERYARVVGARYDQPIRLGLYFPLLQGWREWAAGEG